MKMTPREKGVSLQRLASLAWGDFQTRLSFARSTIPEEKLELLVVYVALFSLAS